MNFKNVVWRLLKRLSIFSFKSTEKKIIGESNIINLSSNSVYENFTLDVIGSSNAIIIEESCVIKNLVIYIRGNSANVRICSGVRFNRGSEIWIEDDNCQLIIGRNSTFEKVHLAVTENDSSIIIGEDCMLATDVEIRTGDSHSVLSNSTRERLNFAASVVVGNHVWVASSVSILKGVNIADNCIVATRSVVSKSITESHSMFGGIPAKVLKANIDWSRERLHK